VLDPWILTHEHLDQAERDVRHLLGPGVEKLLRPSIRPEHAPIVKRIQRLPWDEHPVELVVREAFSILVDLTVPGGEADPAQDDSDVPWCSMLHRMLRVPVLGSKRARQWFALMQRLRWCDVPVSTISEGVSAYAVALMEHLRGRESEAHYWMRVAAVQNEDDERVGLGVAVVLRAARLLTASAK
jgi:hypothetical protein